MQDNKRSIFIDRMLLTFILFTFLLSSVSAILPNLDPGTPTTVTTNVFNNLSSNSSIYWGNYNFANYDMDVIKSFGYNQTIPAINYCIANFVPYSGSTTNTDLNSKNLTNINQLKADRINATSINQLMHHLLSNIDGGRVVHIESTASSNPNTAIELNAPTGSNTDHVFQEGGADKFLFGYNSAQSGSNRIPDSFEIYSFTSSEAIVNVHQSSPNALNINSVGNINVTRNITMTTGRTICYDSNCVHFTFTNSTDRIDT